MTHPDTEFEQQAREAITNHEPSWESREGLPHLLNDEQTVAVILKAHTAALEQARRGAAIEELGSLLNEFNSAYVRVAEEVGVGSVQAPSTIYHVIVDERLATLKGERHEPV